MSERATWPLLILAVSAIATFGCSASENEADNQIVSSSQQEATGILSTDDGDRPPSSSSDEELAQALADTMSDVASDPGSNECVAREVVERIGGSELRALGLTPEVIASPGFSLFIELEPDQFHVFDDAMAACSDPVSNALAQSMAFNADQVDRNCLLEALGPDPKQPILKSSPVSPEYDGGISLGNAFFECLEPVEFVAALWSSVAPRYASDETAPGVDPDTADHACITDWLGDDQRATALTLFELVRSFYFIDDPSTTLIDQLNKLNAILTTGKISETQLHQLHECFANGP